MNCPKCGSSDLTDHKEFTNIGGYRFFCHDCSNEFGILYVKPKSNYFDLTKLKVKKYEIPTNS